jgi:uncharacterized protein
MFSFRWVVLCAVLLGIAPKLDAQSGGIPGRGQPAAVPRTTQYDFTSRITGRPYRLIVTEPYQRDPSTRYPAVYVLDGSRLYGTAAEAAIRSGVPGAGYGAGYVISLGYQTDDAAELLQLRVLDMTHSRAVDPNFPRESGGGDAYLRSLYEEVQPFVLQNFPIDPERQAFWGHSFGGLLVLRSMFRDPGRFSTYLISSPSIWWNGQDVLADEEAFFQRMASNPLPLRVFITSAGDEQPPESAATSRMIDNASDLAERLRARALGLVVERTIFEGENHASAGPVSLLRSIRFAWAQPGN